MPGRYHAALYDSSSPAAAAAGSHQVIYASRDVDHTASERRVRGPLPDLVNVHQPPTSLLYDRQPPTSVIYHATAAPAVNHSMPQPLRSPTCRFIRGTIGLHSVTLFSSTLINQTISQTITVP